IANNRRKPTMTVYKVGGIWRYRFMLNGRRYFEALPFVTSKTKAKEAEDARRVRIREGRDDQADTSTNFRAFVKETFLPWVETNKSKSTYHNYNWRSEDLIEVFGDLDLAEISTFAIEKFKREQIKRLTKRGSLQAPGSVNGYLMTLGSILTRAQELGIIKSND